MLLGLCLLLAATAAQAAPIVPGAGQLVDGVGDDFEDAGWEYIPNNPKSSADLDKQIRGPAGRSKNGRWRENTDRGQPDVIRRVPTPEGGLEGSTGSLLLASKATGIPGHPSGKGEQDDVYMNINTRLGHYIPVSQGPSVVVRVFLPPFEEWEDRTGSSFAFRATVRGTKPDKDETEPYWPGIFINHKRDAQRRKNEPPAYFVIRAANSGGDYQKVPINETGWWTLGMSFSPDGQIHYYVHHGLEDLTASDRVASHYPYNFRCLYLIDSFFDVFGANDGQRWTTGWVIDDPSVYVAYPTRAPRAAQRPRR
ncbi:MAG: hypothetical protein HYX69_20495 [Planctomycetia bacterium]|nr:hypothetical protein [Planctomycetia bacterium]